MATPNIVFVPGIFGSLLGVSFGPRARGYFVWVSPETALTGQLLQLQLANDGVSPGPLTFGVSLSPLGLIRETYGPMIAWMNAQPWNVLTVPYDWRLSVLVSARAVLATINAAFGQAPIIFVCHSMGGLVARAVYALLVQAGQGGQVAGMVTMGTPHFGSWAIQRGFFGIEPFYALLQRAAGLLGPWLPGYREDFLDAIVASWPGWYELAPWRDSGPLAIADPATAQALYQVGTYAGGNRYVRQDLLNAAAVTQDFLAPAIPFGQVRCIRGKNYVTAYEVNPPNPLSQVNGYKYTGGGDGTVPIDNATVASAFNTDLQSLHGEMPLDQHVWAAVKWNVQALAGPGA
jgi:pimeloyl-ACP methyl ester carboxylesterase